MKKLFLLLSAFVGISLFAQTTTNAPVVPTVRENIWDQEDKIEALPGKSMRTGDESIVDATEFIIDVNANRPNYSGLGVMAPQINLKTALILTESITLGISTSFYNTVISSKNVKEYTYAKDLTGNKTFKNSENVDKTDEWGHIDNYVKAYLGLNLIENIGIAVYFGGGSDIDSYKKITEKYTKSWATENTLAAGYDLTKNSVYSTGYGYLDFGAGVKLASGLFGVDLINQVAIYETFRFKINGTGGKVFSDDDKTDFYDSGSVNSADETVETYDATGAVASTRKVQYKYNYFGFRNDGGVLLDLALNTLSIFSNMDTMGLGIGIKYDVDTRIYGDNYSETVSVESATGVKVENKYIYKSPAYTVSHFAIPLSFDVAPVSAVTVSLGYEPGFEFIYKKVTYNEEYSATVGGYKRPEIKYERLDAVITHTVNAGFKIVFPQVVRLNMGVDYKVTQTIAKLVESRDSDSQSNSTGADTIIGGNIYETENLVYSVAQTVAPNLELDFELVKNNAILTLGWYPAVALASSADTNLLNLANWSATMVVKF